MIKDLRKQNCRWVVKIPSEWIDYQLDDVHSGESSFAQIWCSSKTTEHCPNLSDVLRVMLCIPNSKSSSERIFSVVKKMMVDQRSSLSSDTLNSLLRIKISKDQCCINAKFDLPTLKKLKRAAADYDERISESSTASTSASSSDIIQLHPWIVPVILLWTSMSCFNFLDFQMVLYW